MHSMLLSGDGLIIPLKTRVLSKPDLRLMQTHTHTHTSGISTWEPRYTHSSYIKIDTHVKTRILSPTNLLLSGSYKIIFYGLKHTRVSLEDEHQLAY